MSPSTITLLFLLFAVIMFVLEKIPLGVTSMIVCIGLVVTGVLDVKTAFAGFIDSNVILFVAMFIVGGALFETGMANKIGGLVTKFAKTERMLIIAIMVIVGVMSGVLSNTGTAAVLIPVVIGIAAKSGYSRSRLLMPLVFAAAMGGNLSLIGAPGNLIAQSALQEIGLSFGFFEYAIVGAPILIAGILFYATIGYKLLPNKKSSDGDSIFDEVRAGTFPGYPDSDADRHDLRGRDRHQAVRDGRYRRTGTDPDRSYLREGSVKIHRSKDNFPVWWYTVFGIRAFQHRSR